MKRSIQIQIGLVVISIFVLIGVLFYNPADVEKPTPIVVDFGDGTKREVGGQVVASEEESTAEPAVDETDPTTLEPVADAAADEKLDANSSAAPAAPAATVSAKAALLPKGTPPPVTPSRVPRQTPIRLPNGEMMDPAKLTATETIETVSQ